MLEIINFCAQVQAEPSKFIKNYTGKGNKILYLWYNKLFTNCYIGVGNPNRWKNHNNDIVSTITYNKNWDCLIIPGLTEKQAMALEAAILRDSSLIYPFTPKGDHDIVSGRLLNKQRERTQERLIPSELIYGNNFNCIIRGEVNSN